MSCSFSSEGLACRPQNKGKSICAAACPGSAPLWARATPVASTAAICKDKSRWFGLNGNRKRIRISYPFALRKKWFAFHLRGGAEAAQPWVTCCRIPADRKGCKPHVGFSRLVFIASSRIVYFIVDIKALCCILKRTWQFVNNGGKSLQVFADLQVP